LLIDAYCTLGTERDTALSAEALRAAMDAAGVERCVIAPQDREIVIDYARGNRRGAQAAAESERFIAACTLTPWIGGGAAAVVEQSVDAGAKMLVLAPALQGFNPCDFELLEPTLAAAAQRNLPVYLHTGPHGTGSPSQVLLLAQQFPDNRLVVGHCGSTDHAYDMPAALELRLPNVWFELSFVRPWVVPRYVELAAPGKLVFGSGMPRNDLRFELEALNAVLPIREHPGVYGQNLQRLIEEVRA
jgi:predicted TIM-barrel fold metal-dependent hydrolase